MPTLTPQERNAIEIEIVDTLCTVYDPEIPVNIYELGLIYDISVGKEGDVKVEMTLTSPGCPVAGTLPGEVEAKVRRVDGVTNAKVELVWEPAWSMDRMSDEAKLELGML
jgi:FeS assembly SUF system protein